VVTAETEAGLAVGTQLARGLGASGRAIKSLTDALRLEMMAHGTELAERLAEPAAPAAGGQGGASSEQQAVSVFKFDQTKAPAFSDDPISPDAPGECCPAAVLLLMLLNAAGWRHTRARAPQSLAIACRALPSRLPRPHPHHLLQMAWAAASCPPSSPPSAAAARTLRMMCWLPPSAAAARPRPWEMGGLLAWAACCPTPMTRMMAGCQVRSAGGPGCRAGLGVLWLGGVGLGWLMCCWPLLMWVCGRYSSGCRACAGRAGAGRGCCSAPASAATHFPLFPPLTFFLSVRPLPVFLLDGSELCPLPWDAEGGAERPDGSQQVANASAAAKEQS
jgi:hypothetical protein